MSSSEGKLSLFLRTGSDWGKLKTSVPGIFILKMPAYKNSPARLAVELNPVDGSGSPTKKRGIVLRSREELEESAYSQGILTVSGETIEFF